jgi:hypothetical protein
MLLKLFHNSAHKKFYPPKKTFRVKIKTKNDCQYLELFNGYNNSRRIQEVSILNFIKNKRLLSVLKRPEVLCKPREANQHKEQNKSHLLQGILQRLQPIVSIQKAIFLLNLL